MVEETADKPIVKIIDDKSEIVIPFILAQLKSQPASGVFFIGLNGLQGVGKTTLVTALETTLSSPPYSLSTVVLSIDDLYLTHADQLVLAQTHPTNKLVQYRGEPGTHDVALGQRVFADLAAGRETLIPRYDKSQFDGAGDRAPATTWRKVNGEGEEKVRVVLFEGWCVGFRALPEDQVEAKYRESVSQQAEGRDGEATTLWQHALEDLLLVNSRLRDYDALTDSLNAMVHIDATSTSFVYNWRLQQEAQMRAATGRGMTDAQVVRFVDGYYPAYELYTDGLRRGIFDQEGHQLRIVVNAERKVISSNIL